MLTFGFRDGGVVRWRIKSATHRRRKGTTSWRRTLVESWLVFLSCDFEFPSKRKKLLLKALILNWTHNIVCIFWQCPWKIGMLQSIVESPWASCWLAPKRSPGFLSLTAVVEETPFGLQRIFASAWILINTRLSVMRQTPGSTPSVLGARRSLMICARRRLYFEASLTLISMSIISVISR